MGDARVAEMLRDAVVKQLKPLLEHGRHLALSLKARVVQGKRDHRTYGEWFCWYSTIQ